MVRQNVCDYTQDDKLSVCGCILQVYPDGRDQWGRVISMSRDGKQSTYVLDFGSGYKIYTFVIWADSAPKADREHFKEMQ